MKAPNTSALRAASSGTALQWEPRAAAERRIRDLLIRWEILRLCRRGSNSLTDPGMQRIDFECVWVLTLKFFPFGIGIAIGSRNRPLASDIR